MSNTTTNATLTNNEDRAIQLVREVVADFKNGPAKNEIDRFVTFLNAAIDNPENVTDAYFAYYADSTEGTAFLAKYGENATGEDMKEFVQSKLATRQ
jgi:hypothetical protein